MRTITRQYAEAFRLMKYRSKDGSIEWVWNSRDGVSPFCLSAPRREGEPAPTGIAAMATMLEHVDWHEDVFIPNFVPPIGMRIFVDRPDFNPQRDPHNLDVVTVDEILREAFKLAAEQAPWRPALRPIDGGKAVP